jgi:hypothetical protein
MTLDDYLRREGPYVAHLRRWQRLTAVVLLVALLTPLFWPAVPVELFLAVLLAAIVGVFLFDHAATRRLSARYGLLCPHCGSPYRLPLRRRPGQALPVTLCAKCRGEVIEPTEADFNTRAWFLPMTYAEYSAQQFARAVERRNTRASEPPALDCTATLPTTLDDFFRREHAYEEHLGRWYTRWAVFFFGSIIGLFGIVLTLQLTDVLPRSVCGAVMLAYLFCLWPALHFFQRTANRTLSARHGLACPDCGGSCVASRYRRPGTLIDLASCPHCESPVITRLPESALRPMDLQLD